MKITFHGAAQGVTGSRHLVESGGYRVLLDCGLFQGHRDEANRRNTQLGFDPAGLHAIILSHAHIDHSGAIPAAVRHGFRGRVFATPATADLAAVMLRDSAHIQQRDIEYVNKREGLRGHHAKQPIYSVADAEETGRRMEAREYDKPFDVAPGIRATFFEAGHILGSAMVRVEIAEKGVRRTLVFTGDLGRDCLPIVRSPERLSDADLLIMESTYGNRQHAPVQDIEAQLETIVRDAVKRKGKVLIPAFAVGRTQQITYMLNNLHNAGRLPDVPVFVDSPLASEATAVFRSHPECYEPEMRERLRKDRDADPFGFRLLRYLASREESQSLNDFDGPAIIIAASGMCEQGRILHHLANHMQNERNVILFVGYQAQGTLGRRLLEGATQVRIFGRDVERHAEVRRFDALSAHADRSELERFYRGFGNKVRHLFVVHGEPEASEAFAGWARSVSSAKVHVPHPSESVDLG